MNRPIPAPSPAGAKRRWERVVPRMRNRVRALPRFMVAMRVQFLENVATHEQSIPRSLSRVSAAQVGEGGSAHAEPGEGTPPGSWSQCVSNSWKTSLPMNRPDRNTSPAAANAKRLDCGAVPTPLLIPASLPRQSGDRSPHSKRCHVRCAQPGSWSVSSSKGNRPLPLNLPSLTAGVPRAVEAEGLVQTQPRATHSERRPPPSIRPEWATQGSRPMGCPFEAWRLAIFRVWNPKGIPSRSPGLDREAGLPWVNDIQCINPNGVVPPRRNPVGVDGESAIPPRVARSSQPWALGRNPFGIGKCPPRTLCRTIRASPWAVSCRTTWRRQARNGHTPRPFGAWSQTDGNFRGRCPRLGLAAPVRRLGSWSQCAILEPCLLPMNRPIHDPSPAEAQRRWERVAEGRVRVSPLRGSWSAHVSIPWKSFLPMLSP